MASSDVKSKREKLINDSFDSTRSDWASLNAQIVEGLYTCDNCGSKKTSFIQLQIRSADEPMTRYVFYKFSFITCVQCKNKWTFN